MKKSNIVGLSFLLGSSFVMADATDRSSYKVDSQELHIPYIEFNDANSSTYSADLTFYYTDNNGDFIFLLKPEDLQEVSKPHFSYDGVEGPENWGGLSIDYGDCRYGKNQSPIDISTTNSISAGFDEIQFNYSASALNILNNGHAIQANYDKGSSISVNGKTYNLLQLHFHTPSEHLIDGEASPIEMHLVHKSEEGDLAVVGILFSEGAENPALQNIVAAIPAEESEVETIADVTVDANSLLPSERLEYRYSGSLTTPPCWEGVKWFVLQNSLELSTAQLNSFQQAIGNNSRPVQSLNAREVFLNSK